MVSKPQGKTGVITGASSGRGPAAARAFARRGANLVPAPRRRGREAVAASVGIASASAPLAGAWGLNRRWRGSERGRAGS